MMKKGLGRGLNALLDNREETTTPEATTQGVTMLDIRLLEPNIKQPRQYFDEAALEELAASIKSYGIIQPLLVKESGGYYTIIAGERRYRAARLAHLTEVPVVIKEYTANAYFSHHILVVYAGRISSRQVLEHIRPWRR